MGRGARYVYPKGHTEASRALTLQPGEAVYNPFAEQVGRIVGWHPAGKGKVLVVDFVDVHGRTPRATGNIRPEKLVPCPEHLAHLLPT